MANNLLMLSHFVLLLFWGLSYVIVIPVPLNLIVTSTLIVFIGSHRSLNLLVSEAEGGLSNEEKSSITATDAYKFPFIGSAALFSLYFAFKYLDKDSVNLLLSLYFSLVGVFTLTNALSKFASQFVTSPKKYGFKKTFPVIGDVNLLFNSAELVCLAISIVFAVFYFKTKHYMMNNILGISFCLQSIESISIGSYKIGAILLVGLFFYDIFWVFGTDVMVTVAKSFDGPIKILFPRVLPTLEAKGEFSLLGLGDIVIPGLFVALLLRFDAVQAKAVGRNAENKVFSKPFFYSNVVFYAFGLGVTVGFLIYFLFVFVAIIF
jgi:minor histocompatibility antigen H13